MQILFLLQVPPPFPPGAVPFEVVQIIESFFVTIVVIALGVPLIRALTRRFLAPPAAPAQLPPDVSARLERIEQAVDAIAIEVERISEGQRYTTRLMAEGRGSLGGGESPSPSGTPPRPGR